jgi:hypothetical protein
MKKYSETTRAAIAFLFVLMILPSSLLSQSIWQKPSDKGSVRLEILKPSIESFYGDLNTRLLNMVTYLGFRFPLDKDVYIIAQIPFSNVDHEQVYIGYYYYGWSGRRNVRSTSIGNPYLGFDFGKTRDIVTASVGTYVPIRSGTHTKALLSGQRIDQDRAESFGIESLYLTGKLYRNIWISSNNLVRLGIGPSLEIPWGDSYGSRAMESYLHYDAQVWMESKVITIGTGLSGFLWLTADNFDLGDHTQHQFGFSACINTGRVYPGLHFRVPLDRNLGIYLNYVYGINLTVQLK